MTKNELRLKDKKIRQELEDKNILNDLIYTNLKSLLSTISFSKILCYYPISSEVSILDKLFEDYSKAAKIALPKSNSSDYSMSFHYINSLDDLILGTYGIKEPKPSAKLLNAYEDSIIIVPGISFDKKGYRLGYGKGYYDRFLAKYPGIKIGLSYNSLLHEEIPHDITDIRLDYVVSEGGIIKSSEN